MKSVLVLLFFTLVMTTVPALAQSKYSILFREGDKVLIKKIGTSADTEEGYVKQKHDLNGDGRKDLIIGFANCGSGGCFIEIYIASATGTYTQAWSDYAYEYKILSKTTLVEKRNWKQIEVSDKHTVQPNENPDSDEFVIIPGRKRILTYQKKLRGYDEASPQ